MVLFVQSLIKIMERHFHMFEIFYSRDSLKPWISRLGDLKSRKSPEVHLERSRNTLRSKAKALSDATPFCCSNQAHLLHEEKCSE